MSRARVAVLGVAGLAVIGVAGLATAGLGGGDGKPAGRAALPPATAPIERTTLVETQQVDGTLGYGTTHTVTGGGRHGVVTWLPSGGTVLSRGDTADKVDDRPVPLLYGSLPVYRTLADGVTGDDVRQFERNLAALGYTGFTVDKTYSSATAAAVKRWQDDLGLTKTGTVTPGSVLIARGRIRVAEKKAQVGDQAQGPLFTYTGTTREVTVALDVQYQRLARKGASVTVELPDGSTGAGVISDVGKAATAAHGDQPSTITVTVEVTRQGSLGSYDQAPVKVDLTAARHPNVLSVPVEALTAQSDGGYAVEVVEGGRVRTVPVETGVFTQGKVEISSTGLAAGMKVGVSR